ncbi:MAG: response regulator, partial [Lachnospiraceae bacterium]|nr:response regulator [Lachnospiraceae bacterium]
MSAVKQKILIVDDDSNIAELISLYLTKECYDTLIVGDGEAALYTINTYKPDLILLDLMLPGLSGEELLARITVHLRNTDRSGAVALLRAGALSLDLNAQSAAWAGQSVKLTPT